MIFRVSERARIGILFVAFALAGLLAWVSIRVAVARYYFDLGTLDGIERATRLEPQNAQYWDFLGRYLAESIEHQNLPRAIDCFRTSLDLDRKSADTWLDLAGAYESEGDAAEARKAFIEAKRSYPASAEVSWRYGNFLLRQNDLAAGMLEMRHAVEQDPKRGIQAFLISRRFERNFDVILNQDLPSLSSLYLDLLWQLTTERNNEDALKVWARLVALKPKLQEREVSYFVDGLLNGQRAAEAQKVWEEALPLMGVPNTGDPPGSAIWDGGFETTLINGGLAWRIEPYNGIRIDYDNQVKHSGGRSLRFDIAERDISDVVGVCKFVVVEPNTAYEFSAWLRTRDLADEGGIMFRLAADSQGTQVTTTVKLSGTNNWTRVSTPWRSPNNSHLLRLCLSRKQVFQRVPATVWVDDVSLLKVPAPAT